MKNSESKYRVLFRLLGIVSIIAGIIFMVYLLANGLSFQNILEQSFIIIIALLLIIEGLYMALSGNSYS